jgi:SAM-dependent methyltransferase
MRCKFCNEAISQITFDLGNAAISNALIQEANLHSLEETFPLILYTCPQCFLVQVEEQVPSNRIFNDEYVYFSSLSKFWLQHAKSFCENIKSYLNLDSESFVLEIASNDGYLLRNFVDQGINCLGIEPTKSTADVALSKGVPTLIEFFNLDLARRLTKTEISADLIILNNVLAHVPEINDFISGLKVVLKEEGTITVEFPHLIELIKNNQFDTIYHEHFFYFSLNTLKEIFIKHKLSIYNVETLNTHGGSLRIYATHKGNRLDINSNKESVEKIIKLEVNAGVNKLNFYSNLGNHAYDIKLNALKYLVSQKLLNKNIAAFGAAAKGNTFLNYCGIKKDIIDFVVDETPYKIGKYLPQSKIPILPFEELEKRKPDIIVILPWNHKEEILAKLEFTKLWNAEIITFIPKLQRY